MKADEFEKKFDEGKEDIVNDLDLSTARRTSQEQKRINVDFPPGWSSHWIAKRHV